MVETPAHTITVAGLIRNLAPAFIESLASLACNTVPTCKRRENVFTITVGSRSLCCFIHSPQYTMLTL